MSLEITGAIIVALVGLLIASTFLFRRHLAVRQGIPGTQYLIPEVRPGIEIIKYCVPGIIVPGII